MGRLLSWILLGVGLVWAADFYVSPTGTGSECTQSNPCDFQTALDRADDNGEADTIYVMSGKYELNSTLTAFITDNQPLIIRALDPLDRPVLDSDNRARIMYLSTYIVGVVDKNVTIEIHDLVFQYGRVDDHGGGLYIATSEGDVLISNSLFRGNWAGAISSKKGGGVYVYTKDGNVTVRSSVFENNGATNIGGSLSIYCPYTTSSCTGSALVHDSIFVNNSSSKYSGGVDISGFKTVRFYNNLLSSNTALLWSGGASLSGRTVLAYNNTFYGNTADSQAGGLYVWLPLNTDTAHIMNNIFWNNSGGGNGDDLYVYNYGVGSPVELKNNLFGPDAVFNDADDGSADGRIWSQDLVVWDVDDRNYTHADNKSGEDPLFVDAGAGNFRLQEGSPAIDAGTDSLPSGFSLPPTDLDGFPRVIRGKAPASPSPPYSGVSAFSTGVVDMGAYEFGIVLEITKEGSGTVTSSPDAPSSINCGSTCRNKFHKNASITLTASPDSGYTFDRWEGDCSSCGSNTDCAITLDADKFCRAVFALISGTGAGGGGGGGGCASSGASQDAFLWLLPLALLLRRLLRG